MSNYKTEVERTEAFSFAFDKLLKSIAGIFKSDVDDGSNIKSLSGLDDYLKDNHIVKLTLDYTRMTNAPAVNRVYLGYYKKGPDKPNLYKYEDISNVIYENKGYLKNGGNVTVEIRTKEEINQKYFISAGWVSSMDDKENIIPIGKISGYVPGTPAYLSDGCITYMAKMMKKPEIRKYDLRTKTSSMVYELPFHPSIAQDKYSYQIHIPTEKLYIENGYTANNSAYVVFQEIFDIRTGTMSSPIGRVASYGFEFVYSMSIVEDKYLVFPIFRNCVPGKIVIYDIKNNEKVCDSEFSVNYSFVDKNRHIISSVVYKNKMYVGLYGTQTFSDPSYEKERCNLAKVDLNTFKLEPLSGEEEVFYEKLLFLQGTRLAFEGLQESNHTRINDDLIIVANRLFNLKTMTYKEDVFKLDSILNYVTKHRNIAQLAVFNGCAGVVESEVRI